MFRKIIEILKNKNQQTKEKICWPCDWNFQDVENFNAILSGINTQP